jgi:hypothetical protein
MHFVTEDSIMLKKTVSIKYSTKLEGVETFWLTSALETPPILNSA